ncbi:MAG: AraC family transcriptional regulator [Leptothrix sp. (in: Bacteria)]|jgi:AraC-like DNA-binding protein|nr:AraC family transcriptional regulator [Leptothrix sp. (in: b-proteobacteria)]
MEHSRVITPAWPGLHLTEVVSRRSFGKHWHDEFGIGWVEAGAHRSASGQGVVTAGAGDVITVNPGEVHDGHALGAQPRRWHMIYLRPQALHDLLAGPGGDWAAPLALTRPVLRDPRLLQPLRHASAWLRRPLVDAAERLGAESALVGLGQALRPHLNQAGPPEPTGRPEPAVLARVQARLLDDLAHTPSLAELAAEVGLSRFQVLRQFQVQHGQSPHAWLMLARLHRARQLIHQGHTLAEAATVCGFADQSHMTRRFRHCLGYTPGQWQQARRG